jgi:glycine hydroxymethyltransferase
VLPIPDKPVEELDPEMTELIYAEQRRLKNNINLIASENYAFRHTMQVSGSCLMNKYAEGYPYARYYGGT